MAKKRGLGGLGGDRRSPSPALEGWGDYALRFLNPFSSPPGQPQTGPTWPEVVVPPAQESPATNPPGLLQFLNPFSAPPGQQGLGPAVEPIGYRPPAGFEEPPRDYKNLRPKTSRIPPAVLPPGWMPPGMGSAPLPPDYTGIRKRKPVLRRNKPKNPKPRESEA